MGWKRTWVIALAFVVFVAGCGGDDDDATPATDASPTTAPAEATDGGSSGDDDQPAAPSGGNGGEVVLGDETITFDSARCFLEEQDAAAGGGKILFVAQAFGTTAAGEPVTIDVSRYDEDSQFTGDDILLDIGDPFSDDAVGWTARGDIGTVTVDGSTLSAAGLTFSDFDAGAEVSGSFRIDC